MLMSFSKYKYIKLVLFMFISSLVSATNYYVKNGGNDSASGLDDANAWATISKVVNFGGYTSGDYVYFKKGNIFKVTSTTGYLRPAINDLKFAAYGSGNRPIISGQNLYFAFRCHLANKRDYTSITGLEFRDGEPGENRNTFNHEGNHIVIDDCLFDGGNTFENCTFGTNSSGEKRYDIVVRNSIFQNTKMRAGLYINNCDDVLIENCIFRNNRGYDSYENAYEGSGLKFNDGHDTGGGNCENVIVRNNWFENNHRGWLDGATKNSEFYNNIVISEDQPITGGACILVSSGENSWGPENVNIHNNTIIQRKSSKQTISTKFYQASGGKPYKNVSFNNNIVYVEDGGTGDYKYYIQIHTDAENPNINNNLWYSRDNAIRWFDGSNGGATTSFSSWQNMGYDSGGKNVDPLFVNYTNEDFNLEEGSPAIELNAGAFDYQQNILIPVSAFSANDRTPLTTQTVVFTETSTNSPTSWQWTISPTSVSYMDGTSSTSRNPRVRFNSATDYSVTLRAANSAGSDNEVKSNYITASIPVIAPVSAFSANDRTPLTTQTVVFTETSTNSPTSWQWTFSPTSISYMDGTSSTSRNPRVRFNSATVYSVTLKAANSAGNDNEVKSNYITSTAPISPPISPPVAAFNADNLTPTYTQTVTFTDASTNSPTSWQWTFNPTSVSYMDGTSATSKNPHVKFNSSTTYSCTLSASNSGGSDSEVKTNFISRTGVKFEVSVFLAGTYENGNMITTLNSKGFIPMSQPFNSPPWNYTGGETFTEEISEEVVDWILVELRTGLDASTIVARISGIVRDDGLASRIDNVGFYFANIPGGNYYIVIHHRNHLSVMSAEKVSLNLVQPWVHYDFTNSQAKSYGDDAMQDLGDGNYGLYSGDGNSDGAITEADIQEYWIPQFLNSIDGYQQGDFDMDGSVTASDNNMFWLPNNKRISKVPN